MSCLVSVIIPVYKVEAYLCQCVDSILGQTYRDLEIILVDDGSPDGCPDICDNYALQDSRVKVIHKVNGGLSDARNVGLEAACGEYVIFVDSDDYWAGPEVLNNLVRVFESSDTSLDFVNFNCRYYYQTDHLLKPWLVYPESVLQGKHKKEVIMALILHGLFPMSACMKLIRREFLEDNRIRFVKGIFAEDIPWFLEILKKCCNFRFVNEYAYVYRKQVEGTISSSFSEKKYNDLFTIVCEETGKIQAEYQDSELKEALLAFMAYEYCILLGMVNHFSGSERKNQLKKLKQYRWLLQYDLNPKVRKVKVLLQLLGARLTRWALFLYIRKVVNRI